MQENQGFRLAGRAGASRIKVIVTRRLAATEGSSGNNGWVSARPATMKKLAVGTPSSSRILRTELARLIAQFGLDKRVRITGWIDSDQVREEILAARGLVLPSFIEGLPVVIMEAMALRRPVVTTFVAGIPELVRDGENGWLVPAGDVDGLADALVACLAADGDALARIGSAGRERVLARHDVDVEAGKLARLFVAQPGGAAP